MVAGRDPLDKNAWSAHLKSIKSFQLEKFADAEARQVIAAYGVTDERIAEIILRHSDGLPLAVAMLASVAPADPSKISDVTEDIVDNFLRWEADQARREAILAAALPRWVNEDTLDILLNGAFPEVAKGNKKEFYRYLAAQPFTSSPANGIEVHRHCPRLDAPLAAEPLRGPLAAVTLPACDCLRGARRSRSATPRRTRWRAGMTEPGGKRNWNASTTCSALTRNSGCAKRWPSEWRQQATQSLTPASGLRCSTRPPPTWTARSPGLTRRNGTSPTSPTWLRDCRTR